MKICIHSVATKSCNRTEQLPLLDKIWNNLPKKNINKEVLTSGFSSFLSNLLLNKSYIPYTSCVLEHILTSPNLSNLEKLYYLLADSLALINSNSKGYKNRRAVALPADSWAKKLNCSKAQVFSLQKTLKDKGYFVVIKNHNKSGQNMRNLIMPTLPDKVFEDLNKSALVKTGEFSLFDQNNDCKRSYLDKTKLFVRINYQLLSFILADASLNNFQKIIWLDLFAASSKIKKSIIAISYKELADKYLANQKLISKTIVLLQKLEFLKREQAFVKKESLLEARQDKVLWNISVTLPDNYLEQLMKIDDRSEVITPSISSNTVSVLEDSKVQRSISDPHFVKSGLLLNKNFKTKINKNRSKQNTNLFETNQTQESYNLESNFYKISFEEKKIEQAANQIVSNKPEKVRAPNINHIKGIFAKAKELKDFYPLTKEDCQNLQSSSNREFSLNAMNEILLDMSKRLTDRVFKSKEAFLSYMSKAFTYEMRDAIKTGNENFKIKKNQTQEEISLEEKEKYLAEIEYNLQVSPEWHLKKKLACVFDTGKSYELLRAYRSISQKGSVFTLELDKHVELTEPDREIIFNQAKATHEIFDLNQEKITMIESLKIKMPEKLVFEARESRGQTNKPATPSTVIPDTIWGRVRKSLITYYGEALDRNWFSRLDAEVIEESRVVYLKAPSNFIKDWIQSNYFDTIEKFGMGEEYRVMMV